MNDTSANIGSAISDPSANRQLIQTSTPSVSTRRIAATVGEISAICTSPLTASTSLLNRDTIPPLFMSASFPSGSERNLSNSRLRSRIVTRASRLAVRQDRVLSSTCFSKSTTMISAPSRANCPVRADAGPALSTSAPSMIIRIASGQTMSRPVVTSAISRIVSNPHRYGQSHCRYCRRYRRLVALSARGFLSGFDGSDALRLVVLSPCDRRKSRSLCFELLACFIVGAL